MNPIQACLCIALLAPVAASAQARLSIPLDGEWLFHKVGDHGWQTVNVPHSFGGYRGPAWYRRTLHLSHGRDKERHYLEFDGALLVTEAWVNGRHAGRHAGGFARFRFDITELLQEGGNEIAVRVDNAADSSIAPLAGDYTMYGGLYRKVRLVSTSQVHFDMLDYGGPGVYFKASEVSQQRAALSWTARARNDSSRAVHAVVTTRLRDASHRVVASARQPVLLPAHSTVQVALQATLPSPRLWQGVRDPYLYTSEAELAAAGSANGTRDRISFQAGIRDIRLDPQRGLVLNGANYRVHGVNVHQTSLPGKGIAATDADIDADYRILSDLGVTGLRYAHYQHPQRAYDHADRAGWLVWTELPLTAAVNGSREFLASSEQQLRELVRQNSNHPSVMVWGLGNEIYQSNADSARVLSSLQRWPMRKTQAGQPPTPTAAGRSTARKPRIPTPWARTFISAGTMESSRTSALSSMRTMPSVRARHCRSANTAPAPAHCNRKIRRSGLSRAGAGIRNSTRRCITKQPGVSWKRARGYGRTSSGPVSTFPRRAATKAIRRASTTRGWSASIAA